MPRHWLRENQRCKDGPCWSSSDFPPQWETCVSNGHDHQGRAQISAKKQDMKMKGQNRVKIHGKLLFFIRDLLDAESCRAMEYVYITSQHNLFHIWSQHSPTVQQRYRSPNSHSFIYLFLSNIKFKCNVPWRERQFPDLKVTSVNLVDDLQVTGQKVLEQVDGPTLQRLW